MAIQEKKAKPQGHDTKTIAELSVITPTMAVLINRGVIVPFDPKNEPLSFLRYNWGHQFAGPQEFFRERSDIDVVKDLERRYAVVLQNPDVQENLYTQKSGIIVSSRPLLTALEEQALFRNIRKGVMVDEKAMEVPEGVDDPEEIVWLGKTSRKIAIESNGRLVLDIAKRYIDRGMDLDDLYQEGQVGLSTAVDKFEYFRGLRFSTYATWWIRQAVTRALADRARLVRLPIHVIEEYGKISVVIREKDDGSGEPIDCEEIAIHLNGTKRRTTGKYDWTGEGVREIINRVWSSSHISLDQPINDEDDNRSQIDFLVDSLPGNFDEETAQLHSREQVDLLLDKLSERERHVLSLRFGLEDNMYRTLDEVGKEMGITRERARQLEVKALWRLKIQARRRGMEA